MPCFIIKISIDCNHIIDAANQIYVHFKNYVAFSYLIECWQNYFNQNRTCHILLILRFLPD